MSNAYAILAAGEADAQAPAWFISLLAAGVVAVVVLSVRRFLRPRRLLLRNTPGRPNRLSLPLVLAPLLGAVVAVEAASYLLSPWQGRPEVKAALMGVQGLVMLVGGLAVAAWAFPLGLSAGLGLSGRHWIFDALRGLLAFLAIMPVAFFLLVLTTWLIELLAPEPKKILGAHELLVMIQGMGVGGKVLAAVVAVIIAPLGEEVLFRGLLQSWLRRVTGGPWPAILIASALFTVVHAGQVQALPSLLALGLVLGYNYERTGRLLAPILIHALFNAANVLLILSQ